MTINNEHNEKCPTCNTKLIIETRIVDMGLFQHDYNYAECLTCKKQWTFAKEEIGMMDFCQHFKIGRK